MIYYVQAAGSLYLLIWEKLLFVLGGKGLSPWRAYLISGLINRGLILEREFISKYLKNAIFILK